MDQTVISRRNFLMKFLEDLKNGGKRKKAKEVKELKTRIKKPKKKPKKKLKKKFKEVQRSSKKLKKSLLSLKRRSEDCGRIDIAE